MTGNFEYDEVDDNDERPPADAAAALRLIVEQQAEAARRLSPNMLFYYWPWGLAWLIGFGLFFLRFGPDDRVLVTLPAWLPLPALLALLVAASLVSGFASARTYGRVSGDSNRRGAWYGISWGLGFATLSTVLSRISPHLPDDLSTLLWAGATVGLTGALHIAGGAVWLDRNLFTLGAWISVINIVGVVAGPGWHALIIALGGGGGMLLVGAVVELRRRRPSPVTRLSPDVR
ncbi:transporter [Plantactinospora sonchi]|uniref:Transporter n=1 Tax=Plantactinospora sonchi TaxID=1544735 RepID=A0ABU7RXE0_9ACTN